MARDKRKEEPYKPGYTGFDAETTERAQKTADRAQEGANAQGEHVDASYMEDGPREAAERRGDTEADVGEAVERARRKAR